MQVIRQGYIMSRLAGHFLRMSSLPTTSIISCARCSSPEVTGLSQGVRGRDVGAYLEPPGRWFASELYRQKEELGCRGWNRHCGFTKNSTNDSCFHMTANIPLSCPSSRSERSEPGGQLHRPSTARALLPLPPGLQMAGRSRREPASSSRAASSGEETPPDLDSPGKAVRPRPSRERLPVRIRPRRPHPSRNWPAGTASRSHPAPSASCPIHPATGQRRRTARG